ncbi:MAG TPA: hypothetical protein VKG92_06850, partial [Flavobacteriales bacterium]|nr:hypothetical protein [Flavobacteriales bacterium]
MKHFSAIVLLTCLTATAAHGQSYCSPIFPNGCFGWHSQSISIGSLDWVFDGIDCTASDYTNLSATVNAG